MNFAKYHALGNDYIVIEPAGDEEVLHPQIIERICARHTGLGADGILFGPLKQTEEPLLLRIYNPDGSETGTSGNGLRIFSRYLWDCGIVGDQPFTLETPSRQVKAQVSRDGREVMVVMGQLTFHSQHIPVAGPSREVVNEVLDIRGRRFTYSAASLGNPHCVIIQNKISAEDARHWGPLIEEDAHFPQRTNVQFVRIIDRANLQIEIWERGAGYTLASGSSSCAAAAVANRLGLCQATVAVHMQGGILNVSIADDFRVTLTGPVQKIAEGTISASIVGID